MTLFLGQIAHLLAGCVCGALVVTSYRWVRRQSEALGAIFALGILAHAGLALALFWVSYLHAPFARALQVDQGFWQLAPDARGYYELAAYMADTGRFAQAPSAPSPFFLQALAAWMVFVGPSPGAAMFLNLCLYVGLVRAMVWCFDPVDQWRRDLPCLLTVAAVSFSPVILIHSTQSLKDMLFCTLVAAVCLGVRGLRALVSGAGRQHILWSVAPAAAVVVLATYGVAGIRWYYALVMCGALASTLALFTLRGRTTPLGPYLAGSAGVLGGMVLCFFMAGGVHAGIIGSFVTHSPSQLITMTQVARDGFLMTGGGTNIVIPLRDDPAIGRARADELAQSQHKSDAFARAVAEDSSSRPAPAPVDGPTAAAVEAAQEHAARAVPVNAREQLRAVGSGLATVFVPLSVVTRVFGIVIPGGRGLLAVAEIDTIFQDTAILLALFLLWKRRNLLGDRGPFIVFALILSATSAVLLGYVVTNFGTLWRLRSLVAVPLWMLPLAITPGERPHARDLPRR